MEKLIDLATPPLAKVDIYYPESDGQPIGETDFHITTILYLRQALQYLFRHTSNIYVAADMLFYYQKDNPKRYRVPDVFVVKGIESYDRRIYKLWEEKAVPCTIFEITSASTRHEDTGPKKKLYQRLGVKEYFLFDPLDEYLTPSLQGFRLEAGQYQPIALTSDKTLFSRELGVILKREGKLLRLIDAINNQPLPTLSEAMELAVAEANRAVEETVRAEQEAKRAEQEAKRAEQEAKRADMAEAEILRLQAELKRLKGQK